MKNHLNTQETLPKLTKSNLPKSSQQKPLLLSYPWLLVVGVGALSIAIALMAVFSLTNIGRVEKDLTKQTTVATQKTNPTGGNWLLVALLGAGVASGVAIYQWRSYLPIPQRGRRARSQRQLLVKQGKSMATEIDTTKAPETNDLETMPPLVDTRLVEAPIITVLPPEDRRSGDLGGQSLAEMMDIRQHLSLSAILQDFKSLD